jgi:hypothetical protein
VTSVTPITISDRYAGPPFGVNGGYTAGLLAEHAGVRAAHVELSAPVPMGRPLEVVIDIRRLRSPTMGGCLPPPPR